MNNFVVGDEVVVIATGATGVVTSGFFWRDANGKPPTRDQVPIDFDDGSRDYVSPYALDYESEPA